jgi:tRNA A37 methylthiotransferase MiaB
MAFSHNETDLAKTVWVAFIEGCPRSKIEGSRLLEYLRRNNWVITTDLKRARLIILGVCGFSLSTEIKCLKYLSVTHRKKAPDAKIVAFGCLAGINPKPLEEIGAIPITAENLEELDNIIGATTKVKDIYDVNLMDKTLEIGKKAYSRFDRIYVDSQFHLRDLPKLFFRFFLRSPETLHEKYENVFNIRVGRGCMGKCTYCAIKFASGSVISKPLDKIISEFQSGLKRNYSVFRLVGDDVGAYGQDIGSSIVDLLSNICSQNGDFKLIWDDFNPNWLIQYFPQLFEIFSKNISKFGYMGFPIQSGSERILKSMGREYTAEEAKECLITLRRAIPTLRLTTHFIVGFPGETKADIIDSINFVKAVKFTHVYVFQYDDRPNTIASQLPDKVSLINKFWFLYLLKSISSKSYKSFQTLD